MGTRPSIGIQIVQLCGTEAVCLYGVRSTKYLVAPRRIMGPEQMLHFHIKIKNKNPKIGHLEKGTSS